MTLPLQSHPFNAGGPVDPIWLAWLRTLEQGATANNADLAAQISAIATALGSPDGTVANIPPLGGSQTQVFAGSGIQVNGSAQSGYQISLNTVADSGAGTFLLLTRDSFGRISGTVAGTATDVPYDNTTSGLTAEDVQAAIDELASNLSHESPCLRYTTDTGSTADSDPGAGLMKWNNATQSSATKLFFDDADAGTGTDLSAYFTELAASSTTGIVHMVAENGAFQVYKWTGIADGTGYFKFTVTHLCSSGAFADNITVRVAFFPMPAAGGGGGGANWTLVSKTSDQSRSSTTTLADDTQLQFSASSSTTYRIKVRLFFETANGTMDVKISPAFSGTTNSIIYRRLIHPANSNPANNITNNFSTPTVIDAAGAVLNYMEMEIVLDVNTSGTFSIQWAQNASNASNLTLRKGSYIEYLTV